MPGPLDQYKRPAPPAEASLSQFRRPAPAAPTENEDDSDGPGLGSLLLGGAALGAAGLAARNPALLKSAVGKIGSALNGVRYASMLSGMAAPKSMLGNVGATIAASIERKSLSPLREFLSTQTAKDFVTELKSGGGAGAFGQQTGRMNPFGRIMGAGDTATRNAMGRAGLTPEEAARHTLQTPVSLRLGDKDMLNNPVADYALPFRRTPFNQFFGGMAATAERPAIAAGYGAAGAAMGADPNAVDPSTIGLTAPLAGIYALPYLAGAAVTRGLTKPSDVGRTIAGIAPVSEYGLVSSLTDPLRPFKRPAAVSALKTFFGGK